MKRILRKEGTILFALLVLVTVVGIGSVCLIEGDEVRANGGQVNIVIDADNTTAGIQSSVDVAPGSTFRVDVWVQPQGGQEVSVVDARVNFDTTYLSVNTTLYDGYQNILPCSGTLFSNPTWRAMDNTNGYADYSDGAQLGGDNPTTDFPMFYIVFNADNLTPQVGTSITFNTGLPRVTDAFLVGSSVKGNLTSCTVNIVPPISFTATLQGGNRPEAGYDVPLTLNLYDTGTALDYNNILTEVADYTFSTANSTLTITETNTGSKTITFTASGLPEGTYHVTLFTPHCLINLKENVALTEGTIDMGTLLEGNADDSVQIAGSDFSMLLNDYLEMSGGDKWNSGRCDFDRSGQVTSIDFSAMAANYNLTSPRTAP